MTAEAKDHTAAETKEAVRSIMERMILYRIFDKFEDGSYEFTPTFGDYIAVTNQMLKDDPYRRQHAQSMGQHFKM